LLAGVVTWGVMAATGAIGGAPYVDLTTAGANVPVNGAIWVEGGGGAGTGQFDPFLTESTSANTEKGYNSCPEEFDTSGCSPGRTHSLSAAAIPAVTIGGVKYREFSLDANDTGSDDYMSIDEFKIFLDNQSDLHGYTDASGGGSFATDDGTKAVLKYDLGNNTVLMRSQTLTPGSGVSDITVDVPDSIFPTDCYYGSLTCNQFVILFTNNGNAGTITAGNGCSSGCNYNVTGGFEEWRTALAPVVNVTKTAIPSFTRTYKWKIVKTASPGTLNLFNGDSSPVTWHVVVTPDTPAFVDSNISVTGTVTITNPTGGTGPIATAIPASITNISDVLNQGSDVPVTLTGTGCNPTPASPTTLAGGAVLTCTYTKTTTSTAAGTNTATATLSTGDAFSFTASFTFDGPTTEVDKTPTVTDSNGHTFPAVTATGLDESYQQTFACGADQGSHSNTATLNTTPPQTSTATATVNCSVLTTTKTATPTFTRTYKWKITKTVTPGALNLFKNDTGQVAWEIKVVPDDPAFVDSNFQVAGTITVSSPAGAPDNRTVNISDSYSGGGTPVIGQCTVSGGDTGNVPNPYTDLDHGETVTCPYTIALTSAASGTNTATATLTNIPSGTTNFTGTKAVAFSAPTTEVNKTVHVTDTNGHTFPAVTGTGIDETYNQTFACNADNGSHSNTATITETSQSSTATATVNCYELTVSKTGTPTFTRTYKWKIQKTVSPTTLNLFRGDSAGVTWHVVVTPDTPAYVDSSIQVAGTITVVSPAGAPTRSVSLADLYAGATSGTLSNCKINGGSVITLPTNLAGGQTLTCDYVVSLTALTNGTNVATATIPNFLLGVQTGTTSYTGSKAITFGAPTTAIDQTPTVTDSNGHTFGGVTSTGLDESYGQTFTCDRDSGSHTNTATLHTTTPQTSSATATVTCYALTTDKTATPSFTRTWTWTVHKSSPDAGTTLGLAVGQTFLEPYTVVYGATKADTAIQVAGSITVTSPAGAPNNRTVTISDNYTGGGTLAIGQCTVSGGDTGNVANPYTDLDAGETVTCPYTITLTSLTGGTNTATATLNNVPSGTTGFSSAAKTVAFGSPTIETDESVTISDTVPPGSVCTGTNLPVTGCTAGSPPPTGVPSGTLTATAPGPFSKTFTYTRVIGSYSANECGDHNIDNTAGFTTNDTSTIGSSSVHIVAHVPCPTGCTLTQGYWKTHSIRGPAPFDDTWNDIPVLPYAPADSYVPLGGTAENLAFFYSGQTWYQVFWTPPSGGNAYYQLAHQYEAAVLNTLQDVPADSSTIVSTLNSALALFQNPLNTPFTIGALKGNNALRTQFITLAGILGAYNTGTIGPGHCSEDTLSSSSP
jgi:hypothetical protein